MSLKTRLRRVERVHLGEQGWEAPMFVTLTREDEARVQAEMQYWRDEIERDKARGRTVFGFNFLSPNPDQDEEAITA